MWTKITCWKYERVQGRYASDLTDAEWALLGPHVPSALVLGRTRTRDPREVVNAILYLLRAGCP